MLRSGRTIDLVQAGGPVAPIDTLAVYALVACVLVIDVLQTGSVTNQSISVTVPAGGTGVQLRSLLTGPQQTLWDKADAVSVKNTGIVSVFWNTSGNADGTCSVNPSGSTTGIGPNDRIPFGYHSQTYINHLASLGPFAGQYPAAPWPIAKTAMFDAGGAGSTVAIECLDALLNTLPLVDSAAVSWPAALITIAASLSVGLGWGIGQYKPDGVHFLTAGLPVGTAQVALRVVTGAITLNTSGTPDGTVGAARGILTAAMAPSANTPYYLAVGDFDRLGRTRK